MEVEEKIKHLVSNLKNLINKKVYNIDEFNIDGDFIESQAFAYLSIRSLYKKIFHFQIQQKLKILLLVVN